MSLKTIDDDAWSSQLSLELQHQTASYACSSLEKSFLYKALGTTLASCQDVAHVKSQLQKSLKSTDYMNTSEREHVVTILAFSAKGHLDLTLGTLEDFGAAMSKVQVSGIVGRLQDYHQGKRARTHRALIQAYSRIAVHAPRTELLPRVEHDITRKVLQYYMTSCQVLGINIVNKDPDLKLTLIQSVTEISRAIQDADDSQSFQFTSKEELLGYMLDFMKEEPMDSLASPVRLRAMLAIKHLSKVKPSLKPDESRNILDDCLKCLLPLPAVQQLREEGETSQDSVQIQALHELSMQALGELMRGLLEEDPTENWFMEMFHLLEPWIFSDKEWEKDRALQASSQLLVAYRDTVYCRLQEPLEQFGFLLGLLAPYTCASLSTSRLWAAECIVCLLQLQDQSRTMEAAEEELRGLREELKASSPEAVLTSSCQMAKVIGKYLPSIQALDFVGTIMDGMLSASPTCATAAGRWFHSILRENGDALLDEVPDILGTIFIRMPTMQERSMRSFLLEGVGILAVFHLEAVITSLLAKPLPMDSDTSELWRALGRDDFSTCHILQLLMEKIQHPAGTEGSSSEGTAALGPLAATCASLEMLTTIRSSPVLRELLPELLCVLLAQVGRTVGQDMPMPTASIRRRQLQKGQARTVGNPCRLSMETLACAIAKGLGDKVAAELCEAGTWPLLESPQTHHEGVCQLARALLLLEIITPQFIGEVLQWTSSTTENLRVTGTAFISQLVCDPVIEDQKLLKAAVYILHQRARDPNNLVQQMAARGLGNIMYGAPEQLKKHQKAVMETLFQASFVPTRAEITEEGMRALTRVFKHLGTDAGPLVQDVVMHIRPFFNHDNDGLRAVAFSLFGALAGCVKRRQAFYKRQVRQSLGTLLLHLEDPNPQVAKECRTTLGLCCPYLGLRRVQAALAFHIQGSEQGKQEQLLRDMCRHLAKEKPALLEDLCQAAQRHYMSPWPEIRMAAVKFTGILMEYAVPRSAGRIKVVHLLSSLQALEQDTSQEVQTMATRVSETIFKSLWGRTLQEERNHGRTLPHITSLLCFGCLKPRSI
ncbi:maestro heat-like repeat-containing protein family member 2B [Alligator mississippiensis]|uniref:maestro heat-like repeat-containing protein family member 2B n=1 Tax=Alligator mississippiensis TaxID=8496 RepID=UPI0028778956|nr:maestro heat-like repeat-containing protein family member 2B [Alligator mississippiensis]